MLKELINKNKEQKGFTLIELLAVIVILGIIAAIAVPAVAGIISDSKDDAHAANEQLVESAARIAHASGEDFDANKSATANGSEEDSYTITFLITEGYLEETLIDPRDGEEYAGSSYVLFDGDTFEAHLE